MRIAEIQKDLPLSGKSYRMSEGSHTILDTTITVGGRRVEIGIETIRKVWEATDYSSSRSTTSGRPSRT